MIGNDTETTGPIDLPGSDGSGVPTVGYVRLSQESDRSIEGQKRDIRAYCSDRPLELLGILNDGSGSSGFDSDREKFVEVRRLAESGDVGAVVVRDLARLSRDQHDRLRFLLTLDEQGVDLHSVERGVVDTSDYNLAIEAAMAASDDVGKRKEINRSKRETERRLEAGYDHGRPPFGMCFDADGRYWVPGENFETALTVIQLRDAGHSYREIEEKTGVPYSTARRITDRSELYQEGDR